MNLRQAGIRTLLLAAAGFLTSCIDSHEEYWLEADGSGRAEATYILPSTIAAMHGGETAIRERIERFLKKTPGLTSSDCQVTTEGKRLRMRIRAAFDSASDLRKASEGKSIKELPTAASDLAGETKVELHGRTLDYNRTIAIAKAIPGASFLPDSQIEGHRMVYIMHLPAAALESNATRTEDSGRTLVWDFPLKQAIASPLSTRFKMDVPIPWTLVTTVALPVSLFCGLAFRRIRKSRTARSTRETITSAERV